MGSYCNAKCTWALQVFLENKTIEWLHFSGWFPGASTFPENQRKTERKGQDFFASSIFEKKDL